MFACHHIIDYAFVKTLRGLHQFWPIVGLRRIILSHSDSIIAFIEDVDEFDEDDSRVTSTDDVLLDSRDCKHFWWVQQGICRDAQSR